MTTLRQLIDQHCPNMGDYEQIAAILNAPTTVDNPRAGETDIETTATVVPITLKEVLAIVPSAERLKIRKQLPGYIDDVRRAIDANDADYMGVLIVDAATDGAISAETVAAFSALLAQTEEERTVTTTTTTTQPATIAGPSLAAAAGLGTVTSARIQSVLNA